MDFTIPIGLTLVLNIVLLVIYATLLSFLIYRIFRKSGLRNTRILICALTILVFSKTFAQAIILPLRSAVENIEFFVSIDHNSISQKDAAGRWVPFTTLVQGFPITELLIAVVIGIILFQLVAILRHKKPAPALKNVKNSLLIISLALTAILNRETFQTAMVDIASTVNAKIQSLNAPSLSPSFQSIATATNDTSTGATNYQPSSLPFPWSGIFFALGFCVLAYFMLLQLDKSVTSAEIDIPAPSRPATSIKSIRILNTLILLVLAFSLFLVLSVFVTIPYLSEMRMPSAFNTAKLDSAITHVIQARYIDSLGVNIPTTMPDSPGIGAVTTINEYQNLKGRRKTLVNGQIQEFTTNWLNLMHQRSLLFKSLTDYAHNDKIEEEKFHQQLLSNFDAATQSLTSDKAKLYTFATDRFTTYRQSAKAVFTRTNDQLNENDTYNQTARQNMVNEIKNWTIALFQLTDTFSLPPFYPRTYFQAYSTYLTPLDVQVEEDSYIPSSNKDGKERGPLVAISGYLIQTQSSEMVLLIGMLGFGLLGASILSFEKGDDQTNFVQSFSTKPMIKGFGSVLARGFGAALIVYLATKGGLAIFSLGTGTQNDPNGYILLLTCFIGAVYSQQVWDAIKKPFAKDPPETPNNGDNNPNPKPEQKPNPQSRQPQPAQPATQQPPQQPDPQLVPPPIQPENQ